MMYTIHSLSLLLVTCVSVAVTSSVTNFDTDSVTNSTLSPNTTLKPEEEWKYIAPGSSFNYNADDAFRNPGATRRYMFSTDQDASLVLNCKIKLPCLKSAALVATNRNGQLIDSLCAGSTIVPAKIVRSTFSMVINVKSGTVVNSDYICTIKSVKCHCGKNINSRIMGGTAAITNEIPWQAALVKPAIPKVAYCGATLISSTFLITASFCVNPFDSSTIVILGTNDLSSPSAVRAQIKQIISHPIFRPTPKDLQVSLIQLVNEVKFSPAVIPACLPGNIITEVFAGKDMVVSGWGSTGGDTAANTLMKTTVSVMSQAACKTQYPKDITDNMFCASGKKTGPCQGDIGGPLTYTKDGVTYLAGIVSFGRTCGQGDSTMVYSRLSRFTTWIEQNMDDAVCMP